MRRFKFLNKGFKSAHGNQKWKIGKWEKYDGELEMCESGFHCSKGIYQALSFVQGEILAEVEVKGKHQSQEDKEVWQEMRLVKAWEWTKIDSVLFAVYVARLVLDIFEKEYPEDKRPREAIEAAERYAKSPTKKNKAAAAAAGAAAWAAAGDAAWAAWDAAWAAAGAAGDAAWAAWAAAWAAWDAAGAAAGAAGAAVYKKCDAWMLKHLKELKEVK